MRLIRWSATAAALAIALVNQPARAASVETPKGIIAKAAKAIAN
jgi:hypothetical protein